MFLMATACIRRGGAAASPEWAAAREGTSDKTLIRRIAEGDQSAMRALTSRYQVMLYRWLLRLVDDKSLAEDLLSEVFLDVWRQPRSFEGRSAV
jgi:RNA polymerase sigma-70 factor, ECF subfamily